MTTVNAPWQSIVGSVLFVLLLTACQSVKNPVTTRGPDARLQERVKQREATLLARRDFSVTGGVGVWNDSESLSARITWTQTPERLELVLNGPLGLGSIKLLAMAGAQATVTRGASVVARGQDIDLVLQKALQLDAPVPIEQLGFWMRGLPGNATNLVRDDEGKLSSITYTDALGTRWQVRFRRYALWDGAPVPSLVTATGGGNSVRLLLKNWHYDAITVVPNGPESNNRLPIPGR